MIHGFGKFWNNFVFFWRKVLDAFLLSVACHYIIKYYTGEDRFDISGNIILVALGAAVLFSIIRAIRLAMPSNAKKDILICNTEPDAVNVKKQKIKSDINVKVDRGAKRVLKLSLMFIFGVFALMIAASVSGYDPNSQKGSWFPAVVLAVECIVVNIYICAPFRSCKCQLCNRKRAIRFVSEKLLGEAIGDWQENYETLDKQTEVFDKYRVGVLSKEYMGKEAVERNVINIHTRVHNNANLGKYSMQYICKYCGQRFIYNSDFEPVSEHNKRIPLKHRH